MSEFFLWILALLLVLNLFLTIWVIRKVQWLHLMVTNLPTAIDRSQKTVSRNLFHQIQSLAVLRNMIDKADELPPLRGWAASPDFLVQVLRLIERSRPGVILECGSGASTLAIGSYLHRLGSGQIISLDHQAEYAEQTKRLIEENGLGNHATVVYAPLIKHFIDGQEWFWYDMTNVPRTMDMLIVDGPPAAIQPLARYPALPLLHDRLSEHAVVILDDSDREDEQEIIRRWQAQGKWLLTQLPTEKGMAVMQRLSD